MPRLPLPAWSLLIAELLVALPVGAQGALSEPIASEANSSPAAEVSGEDLVSGAPSMMADETSQTAMPAPASDDASRLELLRDLVKRYEEDARDFREQVRLVAERKYRERRAAIEANYDKVLEPVLSAERKHRLEAIAAFEQFIARHPDHTRYTPDAMFRLAELYFEKYDDEYQAAMRDFRDRYQQWSDAGGEGEAPREPPQRFDRTVELYQQIIQRFPDYRLIDGAYYLLGYTLRVQGQADEGLLAWKTLVEKFPQSRFYAEVWFRIGDVHFDEEEWPDAIAAFLKVVPDPSSNFYDKGLYKLAWTYYLTNRFDDGVVRFFELLDYSYAKKAAKGGKSAGSVLEEEALQYAAISFSDDNWVRPQRYRRLVSGDSFEDDFADVETDYVAFAADYFQKEGEKPYERDVMARLGDILFKQSKNRQAVAALKHALQKEPMHRDAPKLQDLIVQAYERERMFEDASRERDLLVASYGKDSAWAQVHIDDSRARKEAMEIARLSLYKAAIYYHTQANKYFEDGREDLGVKSFESASSAYLAYLTQYPHDKQAYELTYYLADTYYYSLRFELAAETFERVRDSTMGTQYKVDAARNVVYSLEKVLTAKIEAGDIPEKDPFARSAAEAEKASRRDAEQQRAKQEKEQARREAAETGEEGPDGIEATTPQGSGDAAPVEPEVKEEIHPLRQRLVASIDTMLKLKPDDEVAPNFAYSAASIFYAHGYFEEAMRRFEEIVAKYPDKEAGKFAANLILDRLLALREYKTAAEYAARFQQTVTSGDQAVFAKIEGGAKFKIATQVLDEGATDIAEGRIVEGISKLEDGANSYLRLVEEDPRREFADLMVYNAAVALERARRPARAAELYERVYRDYPESKFAAQAMFNVAEKSEQAFDFNKAVTTYLALVSTYPDSERRADAQINAALALEGQQRYEDAAREFQRFATLFPERAEASEVFFRAAIVHRKRKDAGAEERALRDFIGRYENQAAQLPRIVEAWTRIGELGRASSEKARAPKDKKSLLDNANKSYERALKEFARVPNSATATYFAAKAAYALAENDFEAYAALQIKAGTGQGQGKELT
ncbi:MAG: tetratricopeptide repeat protein [Myxococcota bacterium]